MAGGLTDEAPPVSGSFRSSWAAVFRPWLWPLVVGLVVAVGVGGWVGSGPLLGVLLGALGVPLGWMAAAYRLLGVAEVEVHPRAVVVRRHVGPPRRVDRSALVAARAGDHWTLIDDRGRAVIRPHGFTDDDWWALGEVLLAWRLDDRHGPVPGRTVGPEGDVTVDLGRPEWRLWAAGPLWLLVLVPLALDPHAYADGSWADDPLLFLLLPLLSVGLTGLTLWRLRARVYRAVFRADAVRLERRFAPSRTVPYGDVVDIGRGVVETEAETFWVHGADEAAFWRELDARIDLDQLSEVRWIEDEIAYQRWVVPVALIGVPGLGVAVYLLAPSAGLVEGWAELLGWVSAIAGWAILALGVRLRARHLLRHADD